MLSDTSFDNTNKNNNIGNSHSSCAQPAMTAGLLQTLIHFSLEAHLYSNAEFYAERWLAAQPANEAALFWAARVQFQQHRYRQCCRLLAAFGLPKDTVSVTVDSHRCRLLLAHALAQLKRFSEAELLMESLLNPLIQESAATPLSNLAPNLPIDKGADLFCNDASVLAQHLAEICLRQNRRERAQHYFSIAWSLNPLMVSAAAGLASCGARAPCERPAMTEKAIAWYEGLLPSISAGASSDDSSKYNAAPAEARDVCENVQTNHSSVSMADLSATRSVPSVSMTRQSHLTSLRRVPSAAVASKRSTRPISAALSNPTMASRNMSSVATSTTGRDKKRGRNGEVITSQARRDRLAASQISDEATLLSHQSVVPDTESNNKKVFSESIDRIMEWVTLLASAQFALGHYQLRECRRLLESLPVNQQSTPLVVSMMARTFFEESNYAMARDWYRTLRVLEPFREHDMDLYSTTLWHLKDEAALSGLGQDLLQMNRQSSIAWTVLGNAFSLQQEQENALKCFHRALQLAPNAAYTHNLCGHEHFTNEAFDRALTSFRAAIRFNPRLYNAWYGLGMIYYRQEKFDLALFHFQQALDIHSASTVLHSFVGMVFHKIKRCDNALVFYDRAIQLNPRNPHVRYRKALTLAELHRTSESLNELRETALLAPQESHVYFKMASVCRMTGQRDEELRCLIRALELEPKSAKAVRDALDQLNANSDQLSDDLFKSLTSVQ